MYFGSTKNQSSIIEKYCDMQNADDSKVLLPGGI